MPFYEVTDCVWGGTERWHLNDPAPVDSRGADLTWAFSLAEAYRRNGRIRTTVYSKGPRVDWTFAGTGNAPILSPRAHRVLGSALAEFCEFIPITVDGYEPGYVVMNVLMAEDCVDEQRSELLFFEPDDGRPDKTGQYIQITKLVLRGDLRLPPIFRLAKSKINVLAGEPLYRLCREHKLTGVGFEKVPGRA